MLQINVKTIKYLLLTSVYNEIESSKFYKIFVDLESTKAFVHLKQIFDKEVIHLVLHLCMLHPKVLDAIVFELKPKSHFRSSHPKVTIQ